jgi:hypothetical protein
VRDVFFIWEVGFFLFQFWGRMFDLNKNWFHKIVEAFSLVWSKVSTVFVTRWSCFALLRIRPSINPLSWTAMMMIHLLIILFATGKMWRQDWVCFAQTDSHSIVNDVWPLYSTSLPSLTMNWLCHLDVSGKMFKTF